MHGQIKMRLPLGKSTVLQMLCECLSQQTHTLVLSFNGRASKSEKEQLTVLPDPPHYQGLGPLAGIVSTLSWMQLEQPSHQWLLSVPGDTPFIPHDLANTLYKSAQRTHMEHLLYYTQCQKRGHYLTGLWNIRALPILKKYIDDGQRSVKGLLKLLHAQAVTFTGSTISARPEDTFLNINTPEDYQLAQKLLQPEP